jgi:hypothetical protein
MVLKVTGFMIFRFSVRDLGLFRFKFFLGFGVKSGNLGHLGFRV